MRLTLRTLLAYMDEILEPADREELAKKVESSEFAHDLIHRTKDTMRRLRLSAPQVVGTGMGLDPNTVAEYLDNVLPPDSVADFERICLESDVHLAEVASAHHVLTMVLGEPADVDASARQRMYRLPNEAQQRKHTPHEPLPAVPTPAQDYAAVTPPPHVFPPSGAAPATATSLQSVPDYLRTSGWTRHGGLLAVCAAVLVAAVGWLLYSGLSGWSGHGEVALAPAGELASGLRPPDQPPMQPPAIPTPNQATPNQDTAAQDVAAEPESDVAASAAAPEMLAPPPKMQLPAMGGSAPPSATQEPSDTTSSPPSSPPAIAVDESAYGYGQPPAEPASSGASGSSPAVPAANDLASSTSIPPQSLSVTPPATEATAVDVATVAVPSTGVAQPGASDQSAGSETAMAQPQAPVEIGTYLDGKNVLLFFDAQSGNWFRMSPRTALHAGDKLLALPAFFPKLALASGLHLKLVGGTAISFSSSTDAANEPSFDVHYGKLVIVNTTNDENSFKLSIGPETVAVRLGRNATLALDVAPKYVPGDDPRHSPAPIVAELFARDGDASWTDSAGTTQLAAPGQWKIENGALTKATADVKFPDWIDQEPVEQRSEKLFGAPAVEAALDPTRPVEDQLLELYQSSHRREVKSLVARSSVYAGLFVPFVEALRDSDQKSAWKMHIDTLRAAMALGPDSAKKIYQTLVDQRGKEAADDLFQMLCGYGPEQIGPPEAFQNGLGTRLVDRMENDSLDYRVLAVQDMAEITGMRLMPNPAGSPTERARGVRLWRQRLKAGEVSPTAPPAT
jgi:hypothetical protein